MLKDVIVEINCGEKFCFDENKKCRFLKGTNSDRCSLFPEITGELTKLEIDKREMPIRCKRCLLAEV